MIKILKEHSYLQIINLLLELNLFNVLCLWNFKMVGIKLYLIFKIIVIKLLGLNSLIVKEFKLMQIAELLGYILMIE